MQAMKTAGLWNHVTGTASQEEGDNLSLKQKAFYLGRSMNSTNPKDLWDTLSQFFETVNNKVYTLMQLNMITGMK